MAIYVRVDDRLIHGQIIANWAGYLNVKNIVGIDDKTANNQALQSIMKMSVPRSYACDILNIRNGTRKVEELSKNNENTLVIVRFPYLLEEVVANVKNIEHVNIGNVSKAEGMTYEVSNNVYLSEKDVKAIDNLYAKGVNVTFKTLPDSQGVVWEKVRDKFTG